MKVYWIPSSCGQRLSGAGRVDSTAGSSPALAPAEPTARDASRLAANSARRYAIPAQGTSGAAAIVFAPGMSILYPPPYTAIGGHRRGTHDRGQNAPDAARAAPP